MALFDQRSHAILKLRKPAELRGEVERVGVVLRQPLTENIVEHFLQ